MTPSETLVAAADLIRDLGANAAPGPWSLYDRGVCWEIPELPEMYDGLSGFREVDARWIAALSPALAGPLEAWLRREAENIAPIEHLLGGGSTPPLDFARAVLGSGVNTHG